jgi:hypothetical protein
MRHIFIVGFAHSGTSLLLAMLGAHSQLHALKNESSIFVRNEHAEERIRAYFDAFYKEAGQCGKTAIVEKTPSHMAYVALMEKIYPDAKIIFTLRTSLDIIASYKHRYQNIYRSVQRYAEQVLSFSNNFSADRHFLIRYETLVAVPEDTLKALCVWLDLPYEKGMLEYHTNTENWFGATELKETSGILDEHNDYRNWQMHQPLFNDTNNYMKRLNPKECACLRTEAGTLMSVLDSFTTHAVPPQEQVRSAAQQAQHLLAHGFFPEQWCNAYPLFSLADARPSLIAAHGCSAVFVRSGLTLRYDGGERAYVLLGGGFLQPLQTVPKAWLDALPLPYLRFVAGGFACIPETVYSFMCQIVFFIGSRLSFTYLAYDACGALIAHRNLITFTAGMTRRKLYFRLPPDAATCNIAAYYSNGHPQTHVLCESLELAAHHEMPVPDSLHARSGQECLFALGAPFAVTAGRKVDHLRECSPGEAYSAECVLADITEGCILAVTAAAYDAAGRQLGDWRVMQLSADCMAGGCRFVCPPETHHIRLVFALGDATPARLTSCSCTVVRFSLYRHSL